MNEINEKIIELVKENTQTATIALKIQEDTKKILEEIGEGETIVADSLNNLTKSLGECLPTLKEIERLFNDKNYDIADLVLSIRKAIFVAKVIFAIMAGATTVSAFVALIVFLVKRWS